MAIMPVRGKSPEVEKAGFIAPSADVIGDVVMGEKSSAWFNVTIRGDVMPVRIGRESNIQDGSTIHGTYNKCGATIGDRVTVGHNVILHGCKIGDESLIGMGSVVMDMAEIPEGCIVGAGSLVTEGSTFEPGSLILGRPAKTVRKIRPEEAKFLKQSADNYIEYMSWYSPGEKKGSN